MQENQLDFKKANGLIPVIIQDAETLEIYMLAYMNQEAYNLTQKTKLVHFWSRSRKKIWLKGEESGNKLQVVSISTDCDQDTLLIKVNLKGSCVCHTGARSCFFNQL